MLSGESGDAIASVAIDPVDTGGSIAARIAETFVDVVLAVATRSAWLTTTLVAPDEVLTVSTKLTRVGFTFINLRLAEEAGVARVALASEGIDAVDAIPMVARGALTVVDVHFAVEPGESLRAVTGVERNRVATNATVLAGCASAIINVDVTFFAGKARRADALVAIDHASADAPVDAWVRGALVNVQFAMNSSKA